MKNVQISKDCHWHKFTFDNAHVLIDVNSGAIHKIHELTSHILDLYDGDNDDLVIGKLKHDFQEQDIINSIKELNRLHDEGMFITEDNSKELYEKGKEPLLKALCLNVAHDCNLRCKYCFVREGAKSNKDFIPKKGLTTSGGRNTNSNAQTNTTSNFNANNCVIPKSNNTNDNISLLMDTDIGKRSIDFLLENSKERRHCEIDYFGGEPLLNFEVVKNLTEYGEKKAQELGNSIKFTMTTNGVLLNNEVGKFLEKHKIDTVLSLDGRKQVNDRMRVFVDDSGTYDVIYPKINKFIDDYPERYYSVRGTYTSHNLDFSQDVKHLIDSGFFRVSVEPVVCKGDKPYSIKEEHLAQIKGEYEKLARLYMQYKNEGKGFSFFHFNIDLDGGPCVVRRLSGCGAGSEYLAVTPEGKIYPCHQFVEKEEYCMGDVVNGINNWKIDEEFKEAYVYGKDKCAKCWARFYCGGGCHANAVNMNNDIFSPYDLGCQLMKKRIECAIWIKVNCSLDQ